MSRALTAVCLLALGVLTPGRAAALDPRKPVTQFGLRTWGEEAGLAQPTVLSIAQTPDGYLWVGTRRGLLRFDGVSFTALTPEKDGVPITEIRTLLVDREGSLWVGMQTDLMGRLRAGRFESFATQSQLPSRSILSSYQDSRGALWFGSWRALGRYSEGRFTVSGQADGLPFGGITAFAEAPDGAVWIGAQTGLSRHRDGRFQRQSIPGIDEVFVTALAADATGLWVGTQTGLFRVEGGRVIRRVSRAEGLPDDHVNALLRDRDGSFWIATSRGVARLQDGRVEVLAPRQGEPQSFVALYEDRERNLWLGSQGGGLLRASEGKFTTLNVAEGMTTNVVSAVAESRNGGLWIGTAGRGLMRHDGARFRSYTARDGLCAESILGLGEDRSGALWVGGAGGERSNLCRLKDGVWKTFTEADGLRRNQFVRVILEDSRGTIWVGAEDLFRVVDDRLVLEPFPDVVAPVDRNVFLVAEDREGALWVGGGKVLRRLKDGRWAVFRIEDGLSANLIFSMHEDADGTLWFGTSRGITRWRAGRFSPYHGQRGDLDDPVYWVGGDAGGYLWWSTPRGVFRARKSDFALLDRDGEAPLPLTHFGAADGMTTSECQGGQSSSAGVMARDGRIWLATSKGVASIHPAHVRLNLLAPTVVVERVLADGRAFAAASSVEVPPGPRSLQIGYTALSLTAPEKMRFKHRLEPFDPGWVEVQGRRTAYYTTLPPGAYRFRVIASNNDGVWNEAGASVELRLRPYFRETFAFRILIAVAVALAGLARHRWRLAQVKSRHAALVAERTRIARDMHDTVAQGFAGISLQLQAAATKLVGAPEQAKSKLDEAQRLVDLSLTEARRVVWGLRTQALEEGDLPAALRELAAELGAGIPVGLEISGTPRDLSRPMDEALLRMAQEAVTNAIKHARASRITMGLTYDRQEVTLRISDDGIGFDADASAPADGHFGLVGIRERVRTLRGELTLRSGAGIGTTLVVRLPAAPARARRKKDGEA